MVNKSTITYKCKHMTLAFSMLNIVIVLHIKKIKHMTLAIIFILHTKL